MQILNTKPEFFFHLQQLRLIELIQRGKIEEALVFAQEELAPMGEQNVRFNFSWWCFHLHFITQSMLNWWTIGSSWCKSCYSFWVCVNIILATQIAFFLSNCHCLISLLIMVLIKLPSHLMFAANPFRRVGANFCTSSFRRCL